MKARIEMYTKGKWSAKGTIIQSEDGVTIAQVWPNVKLLANKN